MEDCRAHNAKIAVLCAACLSVYTDILSYIENMAETDDDVYHMFIDRDELYTYNTSESSEKMPIRAIIIMGCQVTDLAILNDIETAEEIHMRYPYSIIFMGGCVAQRFDIELPYYVYRLDVTRVTNISLMKSFSKVHYQKPFWVSDFSDTSEYAQGRLFRGSYPLKTGAGCPGKCTYCTIRDTRGISYEDDPEDHLDEFLTHSHPVIVADSPSVDHIKKWCAIAKEYKREISFRNVEPTVALACMSDLMSLTNVEENKWARMMYNPSSVNAESNGGLLRTLHVPIQSLSEQVLAYMGRNPKDTIAFINQAQELREKGVKLATNIIIDYVVEGSVLDSSIPSKAEMDRLFDYFSWNPYFDGKFDMVKVIERWKRYLYSDYVDTAMSSKTS